MAKGGPFAHAENVLRNPPCWICSLCKCALEIVWKWSALRGRVSSQFLVFLQFSIVHVDITVYRHGKCLCTSQRSLEIANYNKMCHNHNFFSDLNLRLDSLLCKQHEANLGNTLRNILESFQINSYCLIDSSMGRGTPHVFKIYCGWFKSVYLIIIYLIIASHELSQQFNRIGIEAGNSMKSVLVWHANIHTQKSQTLNEVSAQCLFRETVNQSISFPNLLSDKLLRLTLAKVFLQHVHHVCSTTLTFCLYIICSICKFRTLNTHWPRVVLIQYVNH